MALQFTRRHLDHDLFREVLTEHVEPALTLAEARNGPSLSTASACLLLRECAQLMSEAQPEAANRALNQILYDLAHRSGIADIDPVLYTSILRHLINERLNTAFEDEQVERLIDEARAVAPESQQNQTGLDFYSAMLAVRRGAPLEAFAFTTPRVHEIDAKLQTTRPGTAGMDLAHGTAAASFLYHAAISFLAGEDRALDDAVDRALHFYAFSDAHSPNRAKIVAAPGLIEASLQIPTLSLETRRRLMPLPTPDLVARCEAITKRVLKQTA